MKTICACGAQLEVTDEAVNKKVRCPTCQTIFTPAVGITTDPVASRPGPAGPPLPEAFHKEKSRGERDDDRTDREHARRDQENDRRDREDYDRRDNYYRRRDRERFTDDEYEPIRTSRHAVRSLIYGILGCFCLPLPAVGSILGIIYGFIGLAECNASSRVAGKGLAIAGLFVSFLPFVGFVILMMIALLIRHER